MDEIIVRTYRDGIVECEHRVSCAISDPDGKILFGAGDLSRETYLRSLAKPFQCLALFETGAIEKYKLTIPDIAIIVSSHNGEKEHVGQVRSVLKKAGLMEELLECGTHPPFIFSVTQEILHDYKRLLPVHNNCSGKHAGMLLLCKHLNLPFINYISNNHPLQQHILASEAATLQIKQDKLRIGVDGCGVPTIAISLDKIAKLYAEFAVTDSSGPLGIIRNAMMANPMLIAGTGRFETIAMKQLPILTKSGADGLMAIGVPEQGLGIVVKVHSGFASIADFVTMKLLEKLNIFSDEKLSFLPLHTSFDVLNCRNEIVGHNEISWPHHN